MKKYIVTTFLAISPSPRVKALTSVSIYSIEAPLSKAVNQKDWTLLLASLWMEERKTLLSPQELIKYHVEDVVTPATTYISVILLPPVNTAYTLTHSLRGLWPKIEAWGQRWIDSFLG